MRYLAVLILCLSGCGGPSPEFKGVAPTRIKMGGAVFDVRVDGLRAEAVRLNGQYAPRLAGVGPQAVFAIERVSGCRVDRLTGDQAMMQATLDCGAGAPTPRTRPAYLECDAFDLDSDVGELICFPF